MCSGSPLFCRFRALALCPVMMVYGMGVASAAFTDFNNPDSIVMLGFRATAGSGVAKNLLVSLGSVSEFLSTNDGGGFAYAARFNLNSALTSTFGSDWSRSTVVWGGYGAETTGFTSVIASESQPYLTQEQMDVFDPYSFVGAQASLADATMVPSAVTGTANAVTADLTSNSKYDSYSWASINANDGVKPSWASYNSGANAFGYFAGEQNWTLDKALRFALYDPNGLSIAQLTPLIASVDVATGIITISTNGSSSGGGSGGGGSPGDWIAGSGNWSTSGNWSNNQVASEGYAMGVAGSSGGFITNDAVTNISSLTFSNGSGSYTLTGTNVSQTLTITGGISNDSSATQTISLGLVASSNQTISAADGSIVLGAVSNTAALTMQEGVGKSIALGGELSGNGSLIQSGSGSLMLVASNSYSGGTTINGGTVVAGNNNSFGTGGISLASNAVIAAGTSIALTNEMGVSNGAVATLNNAGYNFAQNGAITGAGGLSLNGAGTTTLGASNGYAGGTVLNGGSVVAANNSSFGNGGITVASNSTVAAGTAILSVANAITVASGQMATLDTTGNHWIQSGVVSGDGGVVKAGGGTLTLAAVNSYTGTTLVSGGTLQITGSLSGAGTVTVSSGGGLAGTGSVGKTIVQSGGFIATGSNGNVGTLSLSSLILNGGGSWNWKMFDAAGVAGTGYDSLGVTGALDLSSLSSTSKFTIYLQTLSGTNPAIAGSALHFDANVSTNWLIANFASLTGTFSTNLFAINPGGFVNGLNGGFGIGTNSSGLILSYTSVNVAGGSGEWNSTSGSLSSKPQITNGSSLLFSGSGGSVTNDSVSSLSGITFATNSAAYTFSGNAITNGGSGIANNSTNAQTISNAVTLATVQTFTAAAGDLTLSGTIGLSSNTLTVAGSSNTVLEGVISGTSGIAKTGSGTLILSGSNSFTGGVVITAGSVLLSGGDNRLWTNSRVSVASGSLINLGTNSQQFDSLSGSGTVTGRAGSSLILAPSNESAFSGTIVGDEAVSIAGTGTMTFLGSNSHTGGTTISSGALLNVSNNSALGALTNSLAVEGRLNLGSRTITQGAVTLGGGTISGGGLLATNVTLRGGDVSANLGGTASVTQSSGITVLGGSNSITGGVTVNGGTLISSNASALGGGDISVNAGTLNLTSVSQSVRAVTLGNGTITGGGILTQSSFVATNTGSALVSESLAGPGGFAQNGTGTTTIASSNSFSGGVWVNGGTLVASNAFALGSTNGSLNVAGGTLDLGRSSQRVSSVTLTSGSIGNGTLSASSGVMVSGNSNSSISAILGGSGGLMKSGSGTLNLSSAIPIGSVGIAGGSLRSTAAVVGAITNSTTSVSVSNGATWQNSGLLTVGGASGARATLSVAGGGSLIATNELLIARDPRSVGTVRLGDSNGAANLSLGASGIRFGAGNGTLQFAQNTALTLSNAFSGKGTISSTGTGTTTLSGNQSGFTGTNYLSSGSMVLGMGVTNGGTVNIAGTNAGFYLNTNAVLASTATHAVAGLLLDNSGLAFTNSIRGKVILSSTGVLRKTYAASAATNMSVAGFGAGLGAGKSFSLLAGTTRAGGADATILQASLTNGALSFKGTFTNAAVLAITDPSFTAIKNTIQWYNTNTLTWQNTVMGNTANQTNASQISGLNGKSFAGSFDSFLLSANLPVKLGLSDTNGNGSLLDDLNGLYGDMINTTLAKIMGAFGYDSTTRTSWAVINHNSLFSGSEVPIDGLPDDLPVMADLSPFGPSPASVQVVPEPGTWTLMIIGVAVLILSARRRNFSNR